MKPFTTRLRYVKAKSPEALTVFCDQLGKRIEIKNILAEGGYWFLWFVPDDAKGDVQSGEITVQVRANKLKVAVYAK